MLDWALTLSDDREERDGFWQKSKAQAIPIEKLRHQLAGHWANRLGASCETADKLQLALKTREIAVAAMTTRLKLPDFEENDKPKRRSIPDHIPSRWI